jgi:hypothetical protein
MANPSDVKPGLSPIERAEAFGIDLSLIEENLLLTPEQTMDKNQAALDLIQALREGNP